MIRIRMAVLALSLLLSACQSGRQETIAQLRNMEVEIREEHLEGGIERAMEGYRRFLEETPEAALTPEAIRRLADLKVEKEYGLLAGGAAPGRGAPSEDRMQERVPLQKETLGAAAAESAGRAAAPPESPGESEADFEKRAIQNPTVPPAVPEGGDDLERVGALEAIALYQKLLMEYPLYERNDQVLYQMSRAYEELGRTGEAMEVMERMVREFPDSRYIDEVQFRRAEFFFTKRRYLEAEEAYLTIVDIGVASSYFELALYKLGWTYYKQELYEEAIQRFISLLDHKVSRGYDFTRAEDEPERKRVEDTLRVISLGFSNLGGADSIANYFSRQGGRSYEDLIYSNLGEFYFDKRRYSDAAVTYSAFVNRNPFHRASPQFHMRTIEIHMAGGFPTLVLASKKDFAARYGLKSEYWRYFEPGARPEVLGFLKTNLTDLANHYHALYQDPKKSREKAENFGQALHWYREFLASFPRDSESPAINYQLADLLLEDKAYGQAAQEYERTAYSYPPHEKASTSGYAAVYAFRKHLEVAPPADKVRIRREVVRSSLKFVDTFPEHEKAALVLGAAADDLYALKEHEQALAASRKLIEKFPGAEVEILRSAWLVVGHSTYELLRFVEAETAYTKVLELLPAEDKGRAALVDNLAASIYRQGEQANALQDYRGAADHFLRVGLLAPASKIRPAAEYDAAAALMQLKDWKGAAEVLSRFRALFPGHELQPEVTKKIAYVYREDGQLSQAAAEYERIERETRDEEVRREALQIAAELHREAGSSALALTVWRRFVGYFPKPVEPNLEARSKIAEILKEQEDRAGYLNELREIVAMEASAGKERTERTRHLGGTAALVLAETDFERFVEVRLVKPFESNLRRKRDLMKGTTDRFNRLLDYEVGEVTAAATYYLAEIYAHFSKALMQSERPEGLSPLELEQYELAIEEQAYPFEEQAIAVHEKNLELISIGIYNVWIERSLEKLAVFVPARYAKAEETSQIVSSLDSYTFEIEQPAAAASSGIPFADPESPKPQLTGQGDGTAENFAFGGGKGASPDAGTKLERN